MMMDVDLFKKTKRLHFMSYFSNKQPHNLTTTNMHYFKFYPDAVFKVEEVINFQIFASSLKNLNDSEEGLIGFNDSSLESLSNEIISRNNRRAVSSLVHSDSNHVITENNCMWETYANNHKGFCVEYNDDILAGLKPLTAKTPDDQLYNVYVDVEYGLELVTIDRTDNLHSMIDSLAHKLNKWEVEQETRLIFRFPPEESKSCVYKDGQLIGELMPNRAKKRAFCAIYIGKDASMNQLCPIVEFADKNKIPCYKFGLSMTRIR